MNTIVVLFSLVLAASIVPRPGRMALDVESGVAWLMVVLRGFQSGGTTAKHASPARMADTALRVDGPGGECPDSVRYT